MAAQVAQERGSLRQAAQLAGVGGGSRLRRAFSRRNAAFLRVSHTVRVLEPKKCACSGVIVRVYSRSAWCLGRVYDVPNGPVHGSMLGFV